VVNWINYLPTRITVASLFPPDTRLSKRKWKKKKQRNKLRGSVGDGRPYRSRIGKLSKANRNKRKFSPRKHCSPVQVRCV